MADIPGLPGNTPDPFAPSGTPPDPTLINPTPVQDPFGATIGSPDSDATHWDGQQTYSDDCALRAQQFIIEMYTGQKLDENALVADAYAHGWYQPGSGTSLPDMNKEMQQYGIASTAYQHANIFQLADQLAQGHKVIIAADSSELWHDKPTGTADHAVVVSGIDTSDPNNVQVIVSDPGVPNGAENRYPLAQFVQSWKSSDFYMVATDQPAPANAPGMQNFDYASGHINQVAGIPYQQFQDLAGQPDQFAHLLDQTSGATAPTPQDIFHLANPSLYPTDSLDTSPHDTQPLTPLDSPLIPTNIADHDGPPAHWSAVPDTAAHAGAIDPHWDVGHRSDTGHAGAIDPHWDLGEQHDTSHDWGASDHGGGEPFDPAL